MKQRSRGELKIHEILERAGLKFEEEYVFPDLISTSGRPLRVDFIVFDDNNDIDFGIEYNGIQHYKPKDSFGGKKGFQRQKFNDELKMNYFKRNNIPLVVIPYWEESFVDFDYIMKHAYGGDF